MIVEFFNEGNRLFDLLEFFFYRNGVYDFIVILLFIEDVNIRVGDVLYSYFLNFYFSIF